MSPYTKNKCRIWLAKDIRQYRIEYFNVIATTMGKNWPWGTKRYDYEYVQLKKITRILVQLFFLSCFFYIVFFI